MPLQSLSLLNSEFVLAQAAALAERVTGEIGQLPAGSIEEQRIAHAFLLA